MIKQKTLKNNFPYIDIQNKYAIAKIALQGAHIFAYQAVDKPALLWLSDAAYFTEGKAIRGGIPLCFPWFGKHGSDDALPLQALAPITRYVQNHAEAVHHHSDASQTKENKEVCHLVWLYPL